MTAEQTEFLTALYCKRRKFLVEYAQSSLHNHAWAEDVVQQTFEIASRKIEDFCGSPNPDGWLVKTLSFVIRNAERRQQTERRVIAFGADYRPDLAAGPADRMPMHVTYGDLVDTPQFRLVYEMEVEGRTLAEIAEDLGISLDACKKRAERARKYLQKKLRK